MSNRKFIVLTLREVIHSPKNIEALKAIVDETGADIVVTAYWLDVGLGVEELWERWKMPGRLVGFTDTRDVSKTESIMSWVRMHRFSRYVILDTSNLKDTNHIWVRHNTGLPMEDAKLDFLDKIVQMLRI